MSPPPSCDVHTGLDAVLLVFSECISSISQTWGTPAWSAQPPGYYLLIPHGMSICTQSHGHEVFKKCRFWQSYRRYQVCFKSLFFFKVVQDPTWLEALFDDWHSASLRPACSDRWWQGWYFWIDSTVFHREKKKIKKNQPAVYLCPLIMQNGRGQQLFRVLPWCNIDETKNLQVSRHPRSFLEKTLGWTDGSAIWQEWLIFEQNVKQNAATRRSQKA